MLDIQTECPSCGAYIEVEAKDFKAMMPLYDEETLEAETVCSECKEGRVRVEISLKATGPDTAEINHVRVILTPSYWPGAEGRPT